MYPCSRVCRSSMNPLSARISRAPTPRKSGKPEPVSLAPVGRSKRSSVWPSSQCGLGSKSSRGGSPQVRTTRLADASPTGASSEGKFGSSSARCSRADSISRRRASRVFTSSVDWAPSDRLSFSGGYSYNWQNSDAVVNYFFNGVNFPAGHSLYFVRNNFFFLDTVAQLLPRLTLYAAYRVNKDLEQGDRVQAPAAGQLITSYPMSFQSPEARLSYRINRRVEWNVGYQYYAYNESGLVRTGQSVRPQNYHAHLPYASLRIYFGGIE